MADPDTIKDLPYLEAKTTEITKMPVRLRREEDDMLIALMKKFVAHGGQNIHGSRTPKPVSKADILRWLIREAHREHVG